MAMGAESNTFSRLSDRSIAADQLAWTPDGRALIVTTSVEATAPPVKKFGICNGVRVYRSATLSASQVIASTSEAWNLDEKLRDLVEIDRRTGVARTLMAGDRIAHYLLSPDGSGLVYTAPRRFERPGPRADSERSRVRRSFLRRAADDRLECSDGLHRRLA